MNDVRRDETPRFATLLAQRRLVEFHDPDSLPCIAVVEALRFQVPLALVVQPMTERVRPRLSRERSMRRHAVRHYFGLQSRGGHFSSTASLSSDTPNLRSKPSITASRSKFRNV